MNIKQSTKDKWYTTCEVSKNIWGIGEFGHKEKVISYLIIGKKQALLFDTGMGIGNIKEVVKKITNLPPFIINSHTHFDHIGGNHLFDNILLFNNPVSLKNAKTGFTEKSMFGAHKKTSFVQPLPITFEAEKYIIQPYKWVKKIDENEIIDLGSFCFKVVHTPGHSPDSICLYDTQKGILFSGDTLYPGNLYLQLPESDITIYKKSLKKLIALPNLKYIFPAHNAFSFPVSAVKKVYDICKIIPRNAKGKFAVYEKITILL